MKLKLKIDKKKELLLYIILGAIIIYLSLKFYEKIIEDPKYVREHLGMLSSSGESSDDTSEEESDVPEDEDPEKMDYSKQLKSVSELGFTSKGSWNGLKKNVGALKNVAFGLATDQTKMIKGGNPIGVKLPVKTGHECSLPSGETTELYTYLNTAGTPGVGLGPEIGNSLISMGDRIGEFSKAMSGGTDSGCKNAEIKVLSNSGKSYTKTVALQTSEIDTIQAGDSADDIISVSESFMNEGNEYVKDMDKLLIKDKGLMEDKLVMIYILSISGLGLYFVYKLFKNKG